MKFKKAVSESKKMPKFGWINFSITKSDAQSVLNKLKSQFPEQKFGIVNNIIHMSGKDIFDMKDLPLDYNMVVTRVGKMLSEDDAVSNIDDADIAKKPCRAGRKIISKEMPKGRTFKKTGVVDDGKN